MFKRKFDSRNLLEQVTREIQSKPEFLGFLGLMISFPPPSRNVSNNDLSSFKGKYKFFNIETQFFQTFQSSLKF